MVLKNILNMELQTEENLTDVSEKPLVTPKKINLKPLGGILLAAKKEKIEEEDLDNLTFTEAKTGVENKKIFVKQFGIMVDLPALYVQDTKFSKSDPRYCLQLVNYVLPQSDLCDIQTHYIEGKKKTKKYRELYPEFQKGVVLRLLFRSQENPLELIDHIVLGSEVPYQVKQAFSKFSPQGKFYAVFLPQIQSLRIAKVEYGDMEAMFEDIKLNKYYALIGKNTFKGLPNKIKVFTDFDQDLSFVKSIEFDLNERFILCVGETQLLIIGLVSKYKRMFYIDYHDYEHISGVQFKSSENSVYECHIACKTRNFKQIETFDIDDPETKRTMAYFNETTSTFQVKISQDFSQIILVNGAENFILIEEDNHYYQQNLPQLKEELVRYVEPVQNGFFLVACNDYDQSLDVIHSQIKDYHIKFNKNVEPGIISIFDFHFKQEGSQFQIRLASMKDDEFNLDKATFTEIKNSVFQLDIFSPMSCFHINWPYVTCSGLSSNSIFVINFFDRKLIHRIILPKEVNKVCDTYITDTNDLFVLTQVDTKYRLYTLDLDASNKFEKEDYNLFTEYDYKMTSIFEYSASDVKDQPILQIHVRGSSIKEVVDLNQKLIVYFLHTGTVYYWTQSKINNKLRKVCDTTSIDFTQISDQSFCLMQEIVSDSQVSQEIKMIKSDFQGFDIKTIFQENLKNERIINFKMDHAEMKMIILSEVGYLSEEDSQFKVEIYDLISKKTIYESFIKNKHLIGRLQSGLFTFVDGHIYYQNNVVKIRYDLLSNLSKSKFYKENEVFDIYYEIFDLEQNQKVRSNTPLDSIRSHRFGYIIQNQKDLMPKQLMLLPYLNERKIYLNRIKMNTDYFYTAIETKDHRVSFICMKKNEREHKYYVYSQNGLLKKRINFQKDVDTYGEPIATSSNGKNYIFQKAGEPKISILSITFNGFVHIKDIDIYQCLEQYTGYLLQDPNCNKKNIKKFEEIIKKNNWILNKAQKEFQFVINDKLDVCIKLTKTMSMGFLGQLVAKKQKQSKNQNDRKNERVSVSVNDMKEYVNEISFNKAYYFQDGLFNLSPNFTNLEIFTPEQQEIIKTQKNNLNNLRARSNHFLLVNDPGFAENFSINNNYLLFWSQKNVWANKILEKETHFGKKEINFSIAEWEKYKIKDIHVGSSESLICIIVNQSLTQDCIVCWDIDKNFEFDTFDVGKQYQIIWDKNGFPYIAEDQSVIFISKRCKLKCYDVDNMVELIKSSQHTNANYTILKDKQITTVQQNIDLSFDRGHRFDGDNHNWIIFRQFICLSFSYMTFVIKEKIEMNDELQKGNVFDLEPYNYMLNKGTCFTDGEFVKEDHQELAYVLSQLAEINIDYIDQIQFTYQKEVNGKIRTISPLHMAVVEGNNRSVDILLNYMTIIDSNASNFFRSILPDLVEFSAFIIYLKSLPVQTMEMVEKQILKVRHAEHEKIVKISDSPGVYIDDRFYRESMGEDKNDKNNKSFPVNVVAMRIDWILNEPEGKKFLFAILDSDNLDLYEVPSLQMLIEYLFKKYQVVIIKQQLPIFLVQLIIFLTLITFNEQQIIEKNGDIYHVSVSWANLVITVIQSFVNLRSLYHLQMNYFKRFWSYVDIFLSFINVLVAGLSLQIQYMDTSHPKILRILESIGILLLSIKSLYYLKLIDDIAPIVDIILRILSDIKYFMVIFVVIVFAFAISFYLLGKNQVDFDDIEDIPEYYTIIGSLWHMWTLCIGNPNTDLYNIDAYLAGEEASTTPIILIFFIFGSFMILIHLLNMLIAIMGESFAKNNQVAYKKKIKDHLHFVMDNWQLQLSAIPNLKQVKYIVTAFHSEEQREDFGLLKKLQGEIYILQKTVEEFQDSTMVEIKAINHKNDGQSKDILKLRDVISRQNATPNREENLGSYLKQEQEKDEMNIMDNFQKYVQV